MQLFGFDIFVTTRNPKDAARTPRQFFAWFQGYTINDTEIYWGKYELVISRLPAAAA